MGRLPGAFVLWVCAAIGALTLLSEGLPGVAVVQGAGPYKTENVIVVVMDGVHYDRTFGDPTHELIPHLWNDLRPQGTYYTNFFNNSVTITQAGHSTIMTGTWQYQRNRGAAQTRPTVIHYMADELGLKPNEAHIVFGKGFYAYAPDTSFPTYRGIYKPEFVHGLGETLYEDDYRVLEKVTGAMAAHKPRFIFANFGVTDHTAHSGRWKVHTGAVKNNDTVLFKLWQAIQTDPNYRDRTTLIITNDHGYMDDGVHDGFAEHGDDSDGSRRLMLLMLGPDIRRGHVVTRSAYQTDIAPTVGEFLGFQTPLAEGEVLAESLTAYHRVNRKEALTERARRAVALERRNRGDIVTDLADGVITRYAGSPGMLKPSPDSVVLLWGLLKAADKTRNTRFIDFVRSVRTQWSGEGDGSFAPAFIDAQLALRSRGEAKARLAAAARRAAVGALNVLEHNGRKFAYGDRSFLLTLVQAAVAAEVTKDEALWHRASSLYIKHVQSVTEAEAIREVTAVGQNAAGHQANKEGEQVYDTGKVLPDLDSRPAGPDEPWYLLTATYLRSHGLPFKGENLGDLPFYRGEVLYRTALLLAQLERPGDVWKDPLTSALTLAGIQEARRRVTLRGDLFDKVGTLAESELSELRPEAAEIMPVVGRVQQLVRERITQMNYNIQYGFPRYQDLDFSLDLLRLYADQADSDLKTGALLLALDPMLRITSEPFVPSPRP